MSLITTKNGRIVIKNAESMMVVPYVYDSTVGDYVLGNDVYDISAVIGDSIVIEQSEGETVTKRNEFTTVPLLRSTTGSEIGFTAQCLDLQNSVLKPLFGAMTVGVVNGLAAFSNDNVATIALVRIRFKEAELPDVILPKVQMNNRLFIQQLHTRAGQGNLSGTSIPYTVCVKDKNNSGHLVQFSSPNTYVPPTPLLFVPKGYTPLFSRLNNGSVVYQIDFDNGTKTTLYIDATNGTWSAIPS